ncbi:5'-nucleotidase C-terminal domain-containing protein [uncultured Phocaeicola sp.]|uniref:bifunctional metallophosphatase/5'-nucleotidase n=1 Tax=uncultured Phocaeicola sp. TaxID=990718 RepID=UPI0025E36AC6|nr:5'-nucleotidase C-terminal domain-containing protein [uncultured Phocaeicola sp.]
MKLLICLMTLLGLGSLSAVHASQDGEVTLKLIETSDVHGCYFPYDFIRNKPMKGSLARVSSYVKEQREKYENVILMDNGDILQGQPVAYYYNYMDTISEHVCAAMLNYMKYDVGTMGNHDVETGHAVYDRWVRQCNFPVLGANIVDNKTGKPYLPPYQVIEKEGVKIAILGMITPAIPSWLPEQLWSGLHFEDMEDCARKWVKIIREKENPDVLVGLFHAGPEGNKLDNVVENGSGNVAKSVPGFDVVFMGHDHARRNEKVVNVEGDSVLLIDPANMSKVVSEVTFTIKKQDGKVVSKQVEGKLVNMDGYAPDADFMNIFSGAYETTMDFVSRNIGRIEHTISSKEAFFGPSAFVDLIHQLQLDIAGADISFCAPLSAYAEIKKGDICVSDMFNLYKYENLLYTMKLTGKEIKDFLEMSYALWTNQMQSPDDHLMLLNEEDNGFGRFKNPSFNFDSAAGIIYTVDVTKPQGEKIRIERMANGEPFDLNKTYRVAVNSYRGNGGGDLLTKGAGIPKTELAKRIVYSTDKDLRYYLMKRIEEVKVLEPKPLNQWKFIPEEWTVPASKRDYDILFGEKASE